MVKLSQVDAISVRAELEGDVADEFVALKKFYGFSQNTELIRFLIRQKYRDRVKEEKGEDPS